MVEKRRLGKSDLQVAPLALGGNVFGWTADEPTSFKVLDAFIAGGLNLIDTADVYSSWIPGHKGGESETVIGNWLAKGADRSNVVIATKCGIPMPETKGGLSRTYIRSAVEASLKRLQTDYIDLYQAHVDDEKTPQEETLHAFAELIKEGKVRAIGASNFTPERLASALLVSAQEGLPRFESFQPWYNLHDRANFEGPLQDLCTREGIGVINYFSLASGFLTGKYRKMEDLEGRPRAYRVKEAMNERGMRILAALDAAGKKSGATPAQISIAWLRAHGVTAPIASATTVEQVRELIGAATLNLDADTVKALDKASEGSVVAKGF
jgi:aryl-alcohol dehydrogenase-like predicted oxidoreductase